MNSFLIFIFFILFPFGQIIRLGNLHPIDIIAGMSAIYVLFRKFPKPKLIRHFNIFLLIAAFSFLISVPIFRTWDLVYGFLYLIRLIAYTYFFVLIWNFIKGKPNNKTLVLNSALIASVASALFGWMQFALYPNIKALTVWGWDDHYLRLVGTFLDPTFLGIIIVFGILVSMYYYIETKKKAYIFALIFLFVSLAFTYSRASYLALFAGLLTFGCFYRKHFIKLFVIIFAFIFLIFLLPTSKNHILSFTRTFSAINRIDNYKSTLSIFQKYPLFGTGYNNFCLAYQKYFEVGSFSSHACSGSDSSLLFVLATTGITGFLVFASCLWHILYPLRRDRNYYLLLSIFFSLLVHSLFSNSLFYPWVMGYMAVLLTISIKE